MNSTCHKQQCICSRNHVTLHGLTCNETLKDLPSNMGWPSDGCTGKRLFTRDMAPMQWYRQTRLSKVDNIKVFKPFEKTKIPILKDIKIVLEAPLLQTADTHMGQAMQFSIGCYLRLYDYVVRATMIVGRTQGMGHSLGRRLLEFAEEQIWAGDRALLHARAPDAAAAAAAKPGMLAKGAAKAKDALKKELSLIAAALRIDLPRGIRMSDFFPFMKG